MKSQKVPLILLLMISGFLTSCEETSTLNCVKRWVLYNNQGLSISFDNNGHMFAGSNAISSAVPPTRFQYQDTISGDFEMVLEFEGLFFNSPGLGLFIGLTASAINQGNNYMTAQIGTSLTSDLPPGVLRIGATIDSLGNPASLSNGSYLNAAGNSGEFRIRRFGSTVEVISSTGSSGNLVTYSKTFFTSPMVVAITYGSNYPNTPPYTSSVRFTNFRYYQGSTLVDSDGFDCNSLH